MKKLIAIFTLLFILILSGCGSPKVGYEVLGTHRAGDFADIVYIKVDTDDMKALGYQGLKPVVRELIKDADTQKMSDNNTAYYFFERSQDVTIGETVPEKEAKAHYWYLTRKLLIKGIDGQGIEIDLK